MIAMMRPRVAVADLRIAKPEDKQAAPHYATPEHKAWRAAVIARAGGACQWPDCGRRERRMFPTTSTRSRTRPARSSNRRTASASAARITPSRPIRRERAARPGEPSGRPTEALASESGNYRNEKKPQPTRAGA